MPSSNILAIPQVEENQNNRYITTNNAVSYLEQALQNPAANTSVGAGPWTITEAVFIRNFSFRASGASGAFDVVVPGEINAVNGKRMFAVINADTTYTATVKTDGSGTTVVLAPGQIALIQQDHDDLRQLTSIVTSYAYDLGFFVPGLPTDAGTVMIWKAVRAFTLADDFAGSQCKVGANPTSTAVFDVQKNESSIGSISINTSGVATFSTTGAGVSMAVGDRLKVVAPTPQDATLSDVGVAFLGTRT